MPFVLLLCELRQLSISGYNRCNGAIRSWYSRLWVLWKQEIENQDSEKEANVEDSNSLCWVEKEWKVAMEE